MNVRTNRGKTFLDPSIKRKSSIVDENLTFHGDKVPLPSVVEISESGTCNRTCSFCPRSAPAFPDVKEFISDELIEKLVRQLAELNYKGIFLFSGFVEPLLDKNIFNLLKIVRSNLPEVRLELVTNGDVLDAKRLKLLFENGLSTLLISVYDGPEDVERFENLCRDEGLDSHQFVIRKRYLPPEQDFGITLSNRAGMMDSAEYSIDTPPEPIKAACNYPHYTFFMDYTGDVLMCPHDWGKMLVVGNMNESNFLEIWAGRRMRIARKRLAAADRDFGPCRLCDVKGTLMGSDHVEAWEKFERIVPKGTISSKG